MAGAITFTSSRMSRDVKKYSFAWTSDAAGAVSGIPQTLPAGSIVAVEFVPGAGGVQPTDLYDITLTDADGINVIDDGTGAASIGANLSNANSSHKVPFVGGGAVTYVRRWLHGGAYTLVVANAGNAKSGTVNLYLHDDVL